MSSHLAALATLALAILLSPETLVLGLIIASDRKVPRLAAAAFAIGAVVGIAFATALGLWIAHVSDAGAATERHGTWPGFVVRVILATTLLVLGLYRAANAFRKQPISDISRPEHKPSKLRARLTQRFPNLARYFDPDADLSVRQRVTRAGLAGFAMCGLHPKVFPIAIAAGHQITQIASPAQRGLGIAVFAAISVIPALVPVIVDFVSPGATTRIKDGYERVMKVHGRWITAVLLLLVAAFIGHDAWQKMPSRHIGA